MPAWLFGKVSPSSITSWIPPQTPLRVLDLNLVASGAVSKHDSKSYPSLRNARCNMQRRASHLQSQNAFNAGALHPSRGARVPGPATSPDVRRENAASGDRKHSPLGPSLLSESSRLRRFEPRPVVSGPPRTTDIALTAPLVRANSGSRRAPIRSPCRRGTPRRRQRQFGLPAACSAC